MVTMRLRGRPAFEIAARLRARDVPTIFATGYDLSMLPKELANAVPLEKPVDLDELCRAVEACCL